jgi:hypothetical protein
MLLRARVDERRKLVDTLASFAHILLRALNAALSGLVFAAQRNHSNHFYENNDEVDGCEDGCDDDQSLHPIRHISSTSPKVSGMQSIASAGGMNCTNITRPALPTHSTWFLHNF